MIDIERIPFKPPDYDPYEEDCAGTHPGETIIIKCRDGLRLRIEEIRSGIGNSLRLSVTDGSTTKEVASVFIDDDGVLTVLGTPDGM